MEEEEGETVEQVWKRRRLQLDAAEEEQRLRRDISHKHHRQSSNTIKVKRKQMKYHSNSMNRQIGRKELGGTGLAEKPGSMLQKSSTRATSVSSLPKI